MENNKKHLVTSALPYANGPLHIGHIAGAYLPADIYVRYLRMMQEDVAFICGSDEHGAAITLRAKKEGITPQEIVDKYHYINKNAFKDVGISFDIYHRTSDPLHHATAAEYFKELNDKGSFEVTESEQFYDEEFNQFLADRYITGTCPKCGHEGAYGDQCENCGSSLSPTDLIDPKSTLSGKTPILRQTKHWYLPMQNHEEWLRTWIKEGKFEGKQTHDPKDWRNQVVGQCMSWIDGGLAPRAITRDLDWGVKVPVEGADGKVLYVWFDAPIGYISATKQWAKDQNKNWEDYWKADNAELTHFIAKDNIVFHCIIFPIILKEIGGFNMPVNVPANEFLNLEGDKISTSREWAVWLHEYLEDFPGRQDELRYTLASIMPESKDSEFTWKEFQSRVNSELADILGNFINRALVLTNKYYGGEIPAPNAFTEEDEKVIEAIKRSANDVGAKIKKHKYREALAEAMMLAREGNKYLADTEPWKLAKTDPERVKTIMYLANQVVANLSVVLKPFLPFTADKLAGFIHIENNDWSKAGNPNLLPAGSKVDKPTILFKKIEDAEVAKEVGKLEEKSKAKLAAAQEANMTHEPQKENIPFDQFTGLDLRIGEILEAEKVKKADKLLKLTVDTGLDKRTIVSGIAQHYSPEEVVGKKVLVLMNLEPRKIRGVESNGMLLMAENVHGNLSFLEANEETHEGSVVG